MFQWISPNYEYRYVNVLAAAAAAAASAGLHPGRGRFGDDEVLRRAPLHLHVRLRASPGGPPLVRRLPAGRGGPGLRARTKKIAFSVPVYVADTDERAHREARQALEWLFHQGLKMPPQIHNPPGTCRCRRCAGC